MRLGYIRIPDHRPSHDPRTEIQDRLSLCSQLGVHVAYLPDTPPEQLEHPHTAANSPKIALDASAFGPLSPSELEQAVRKLNNRLGGKLCLGVEMSCARVSAKRKANAQAFETMFSHDPRPERVKTTSRFPMTPHCPKIIGIPLTGHRDEAALAAARGYFPMTPSWLTKADAAQHWPAIVQGATSAVRRACTSHWQMARMIVIHEDQSVIDAYVFGSGSPIRRHFARLSAEGLIGGDIDTHMKRVVISGSASKVAEDILALRETVGEFGTLHCVDPSGSDPTITRNTMIALAQTVLPMVDTPDTHSVKTLEKT